MAHSVMVITNGEKPSDRMENTRFKLKLMSLNLRRNAFFGENTKIAIHTNDIACDKIVASAAPFTPIPNAKINSGSSAMLATAPISTDNIAVTE